MPAKCSSMMTTYCNPSVGEITHLRSDWLPVFVFRAINARMQNMALRSGPLPTLLQWIMTGRWRAAFHDRWQPLLEYTFTVKTSIIEAFLKKH